MPSLVTTDWLAAELDATDVDATDLRIVDGSWYLSSMQRDPEAEYLAGHLPRAIFFDLDASSDTATALPHMLPDAATFAQRMESLGIGDEHRVVVYDGSGINLSAPRVWWMFRAFGHQEVAVLDGGIGKWRREGRPLEPGRYLAPPARFTARLDRARVRDLEAVRRNIGTGIEQVVDMRPAGRFEGRAPEPRPGVRSGHIPGSRSLPFTSLVADDGTMLPPAELRDRLRTAGVEPGRPVVATCGSGTTACALVLALDLLGISDAAVYDGSWSEWGGASGTPVATGPARPD